MIQSIHEFITIIGSICCGILPLKMISLVCRSTRLNYKPLPPSLPASPSLSRSLVSPPPFLPSYQPLPIQFSSLPSPLPPFLPASPQPVLPPPSPAVSISVQKYPPSPTRYTVYTVYCVVHTRRLYLPTVLKCSVDHWAAEY